MEFYVFEDASGQEMMHIVVDATAAELGYQASLDHFQNGHVDGGSGDSHYEFFELLAPRAEAQAEGSHHHADVPFEGLIRSDPRESFLDHPYLDVDGQGGDAFVFRVLAWRGDEAETGLEPLRFRPSGVVDGGTSSWTTSILERTGASTIPRRMARLLRLPVSPSPRPWPSALR